MAAGEVELRIAERKPHDVAFEESHVVRRARPRRVEIVDTRVDSDGLGDVGRERESDGSRATAGIECHLVAGERPEQASEAIGEIRSSLLL